MRFPITNGTDKPLILFVELETEERTIPPGFGVVVTLSDNPTSYIEIRDGMVVVWNNGPGAAIIGTISPQTEIKL